MSAYLSDEDRAFLVNLSEIEDFSNDDELADTTWVPAKKATLSESSSESSEDDDDHDTISISNDPIPGPSEKLWGMFGDGTNQRKSM